jgi:hypothetical protein
MFLWVSHKKKKKKIFFASLTLMSLKKGVGSWVDPYLGPLVDPHQNVTVPQHRVFDCVGKTDACNASARSLEN